MDMTKMGFALLSLALMGFGMASMLFCGFGMYDTYLAIRCVDENGKRGTYHLGNTVLYTLGVGMGVSMVMGSIWILIEIYLK